MKEADEFYDTVIPQHLSSDARNVMRQSFGGLLWSKQFYHYVVKDWLERRSEPAYAARASARTAAIGNGDISTTPT